MTSVYATDTAIRFFIAVPGDDQGAGIYGLGLSHEAAEQDAYDQGQISPPTLKRNDDGTWTVYDPQTGESHEFTDEHRARCEASELGFVARECTERLYGHIEAHGCDATNFRWSQPSGGLDDLEIDEDEFRDGLGEVMEGFNGVDDAAWSELSAETALKDAHDYVDLYLVGDENSEFTGDVSNGTQLRTALVYAVRDKIVGWVREREAA